VGLPGRKKFDDIFIQGLLSLPPLRGRLNSYSWEGKGRYGSFRLRINVWVCR